MNILITQDKNIKFLFKIFRTLKNYNSQTNATLSKLCFNEAFGM